MANIPGNANQRRLTAANLNRKREVDDPLHLEDLTADLVEG